MMFRSPNFLTTRKLRRRTCNVAAHIEVLQATATKPTVNQLLAEHRPILA